MLPRVWQKLDGWVRSGTPCMLAFGLILLGVVPWPLPGLSSVAPLFGLIAVHYWTVHQPEIMPAAGAFALGLARDILGGAPIGLNAFVLVLVQGVVLTQRRHFARRPFAVDWCGFAMIAAGAVAITWAAGSVYFAQPVSVRPLVFQYLLTVCAYPLFAWLFARIRSRLYRSRSGATGI